MPEPDTKKQKTSRDPLILNFFEAFTPVLHAPGQWRNPRDKSRNYYKAEHWVKLAQLAERGKIHAIFVGDSLGVPGAQESQGLDGPYSFAPAARAGNNFPKNDPTSYLSAVAISTKNVSLGITCSTVSEHPYHFARRAATFDHISGGRFGWNVVTTANASAGRQLTEGNKHLDKEVRYEKADEYLQVFYELLLSSWRDDALVWDVKKGVVMDPDRVREINYNGTHYKVPGPQITEPTEGRIPLIIQAGGSEKGTLLGAKHGELIFIHGHVPGDAKKQIEKTKKLAKEKFERDPSHMKFVCHLRVVLGKTHEEALAKAAEIEEYHDEKGSLIQVPFDLSIYGWEEDLTKVEDPAVRGFATDFLKRSFYKEGDIVSPKYIGRNKWRSWYFIGTPEEVADDIEAFIEDSGVDGFNFDNVLFPETFTDIVELLVPELQKRGLAQEDYAVEGGSFREQVYRKKGHKFVPEDHYAYDWRWKAGESKEAFEKRVKELEKKKAEHKITRD